MKRKDKLPELLAPAGSMEALYAAVLAGADAVYVGGKRFGARAFAKNFDLEELALAVKYCHLWGVKLYVTVNTLVFDRELAELSDYAAALYEMGVDAVICTDLGAIAEMRRRVPGLELHASTQASVHNTDGARIAHKLGCKRVVLARELSRAAIAEITENAPTETEVFLHGALCVCHSGQCLFSSLVGGRSGNRGECAQPCRLPYNGERYPLSLKDAALAYHIPELIETGARSLKIEGRMKSPSYVYGVTRIYRRLLDEHRRATAEEVAELAKIFSRGGFTDGYFTGRLGGMTGVRSEEDKEATRAGEEMRFLPVKKKVRARARFAVGERAELTLTDGKRTLSVTGETVEAAISAPLAKGALSERLSKMGNTLLSLAPEDIEIELSDGANLPVSAINDLRRKAAEKFEYTGRALPENTAQVPTRVKKTEEFRTALFLDGGVLSALGKGDLEGFDAVFTPLFADNAAFGTANGVYLPPVLLDADIVAADRRVEELKNMGVMYTLVNNLSHIEIAKKHGLIPVADIRMNITNGGTKAALGALGVSHFILSAELDLPKARDVGGAVTVYGRIPLMITERCFTKEVASCAECGSAQLVDRMGKRFPLVREFEHRTLVLNSEITYMADKGKEIRGCGLSEHFIFTTEGVDEVRRVLSAFKSGAPIQTVYPTMLPRRIGMREFTPEDKKRAENTARGRKNAAPYAKNKAKPQFNKAVKKKPRTHGGTR